MKNLLIYIHPDKYFDKEARVLAKIQIDNSLDLGWKKEDLLLVTNFPYEYQGVKAFIIPDDYFNKLHKQATKIDVMVHLFDIGFIGGELYWLHDFDAYQQVWIEEEELGLENIDLGLTDYGREEKWNGGSTFLRKESKDLYKEMKIGIYRENENNTGKVKNEEDVLMIMFGENFNNIKSRTKRLNISYNFGIKRMKLCYDKAIKPIKILHFHPERIYSMWGRAFNIVCGNNELGHSIMDNRLKVIFNKHGITA